MENASSGPRQRSWARRMLLPPLIVLAALLVFVEETLIDFLSRLMARLGRLKIVARAEAWAARLPPYPAMALFLLPGAVLLPFKFLALWLIASGHAVTGLTIVLAGKVVGTALSARIYKILRPSLSRLAWFVRAETWVFAQRDWLYGWVKSTQAWQAIRAAVDKLRGVLRRRRSWVARYLRSVRARMRAS